MEHYERVGSAYRARTGGRRSGAHRPQDGHTPLAGRRSCRGDGGVSARARTDFRAQPRTSKRRTSIRSWGWPPFAAETTRRPSSGPSARCNRRSGRSRSQAPTRAHVRKAATDGDRASHQYDRRRARAVGSARRRPRAHRAEPRRGAGSRAARRRVPRLRESRRPLQLGRAETRDRRLAHRARDRVEDRRRLAPVVYLREPGRGVLRPHGSLRNRRPSGGAMPPPRSTASWDSWTTSRFRSS